MHISQNGINSIVKHEGLVLKPYKAAPQETYLTIGYGHYGPDVKPGMSITKEQAAEYLKKDIRRFENAVNSKNLNINQAQFDALVSFVYNVGEGNFNSSTLLKRIKKNPNDPTIRDAFLMWCKCKGQTLPELQRRRNDESNMYFGANVPSPSIDDIYDDNNSGGGAYTPQPYEPSGDFDLESVTLYKEEDVDLAALLEEMLREEEEERKARENVEVGGEESHRKPDPPSTVELEKSKDPTTKEGQELLQSKSQEKKESKNSSLLKKISNNLPKLPGLDTDTIIENNLNNMQAMKDMVASYQKILDRKPKDNATKEEMEADKKEKEIAQQQMSTQREQMKEQMRPDTERSVIKIGVLFKEVKTGLSNISSAISSFLSNQLIPSTIVVGSATGTANPGYFVNQAKSFKAQMQSLLTPITTSYTDMVIEADKINYELPEEAQTMSSTIISTQSAIESIPTA